MIARRYKFSGQHEGWPDWSFTFEGGAERNKRNDCVEHWTRRSKPTIVLVVGDERQGEKRLKQLKTVQEGHGPVEWRTFNAEYDL